MLFILCGPAMSWSLHNGSQIFLGTSQKYGLVWSMIVCSPINDAAEKLLGRSPSINTAKVIRKNKPICLHLCGKMHWKPSLYYIVILFFFSTLTLHFIHWTYICLDNGWIPSALFNRTNIIHMPTTVSRSLNIICIMFKIIAFFI